MFNPGEELSSLAFDKIIGGALNAVVAAQNTSSLTTVDFIKSVGFENDKNGNTSKPIYVDFKYPKEVKPFAPGAPKSASVEIENGGSGYTQDALEESYDIGGGKVTVNFDVDATGAIVGATIAAGAEKVKGAQNLTLKAKAGSELGQGAVIKLVEVAARPAEAAVYQNMTLEVPILTMLPIPFIRIATTDLELNVKINSISNTASSSETKVDANVKASASYRGILTRASVDLNTTVAHQSKSSSSEEVKKEYSLNIKIHAVQDEMPAGLSRLLDILESTIVPKSDAALTAPKVAAVPETV